MEEEKEIGDKRHKVVRFLISPNQKKVKIEVNKTGSPRNYQKKTQIKSGSISKR